MCMTTEDTLERNQENTLCESFCTSETWLACIDFIDYWQIPTSFVLKGCRLMVRDYIMFFSH